MKPFADDSSTLSFGPFTMENGPSAISASGDLEITRDKAGLDRARKLAGFFSEVVAALEATPDLPEKAQVDVAPPARTKNPFA